VKAGLAKDKAVCRRRVTDEPDRNWPGIP